MNPHLVLYFVLDGSVLSGYSDEAREDVVERIDLSKVAYVDVLTPERFQLVLGDGETSHYFECEEGRESAMWVATLRSLLQTDSFIEQPEVGTCELFLDVADEVDVPRVSSPLPPLPPRPAGKHVTVCPVCQTKNAPSAPQHRANGR